jgi:hypothetical protein
MNEQERLSQLFLLPPPTNTAWSGAGEETFARSIGRRGRPPVSVALPLFWYDPPWCGMPAPEAQKMAIVAGQQGVMVSAMRSDLGHAEGASPFHGDLLEEPAADPPTASETAEGAGPLRRLMPYRPERYGLTVRDFDDAAVIDVRLMMSRDPSGRFAYSPAQLERWEATPKGEPVSGGGWVPTATFPPDVRSMRHLAGKFNQLRSLAPSAAVFVSINAFRLHEDLPGVLAAGPDGLILRLDDVPLGGLELAELTRRARHLIDEHGSESVPLWIVPGEVTPDDVVKLLALGASAVAIDRWCESLINAAERSPAASLASNLRRSTTVVPKYLADLAAYQLGPLIERVEGLCHSLGRVRPGDRLGSFNDEWADTLGVRKIG